MDCPVACDAGLLRTPLLAQSNPRILVLVEADSRLPLSASVLSGMEEVLSEDFMTRGDIYVELLDMFRFASPEQQDRLRDLLVVRHGVALLDAVVVLGPNALRFALANRTELAPDAADARAINAGSRVMSEIVYLVDDDPGVLRGLVRRLEAEGFDVSAHGDAATFLAAHDTARGACGCRW